jgi:two-component sensor histidine kinase
VASTLKGKIRAMKEVHDVIAKGGGTSVDLSHLLTRLLNAMVPDERRQSVRVSAGPTVNLKAQQASALAIIIQELTTNCFKHGALGQQFGSVEIRWDYSHEVRQLELKWIETQQQSGSAGPKPDPEGGMGLTLIDGFARSDLRGSCAFARSGNIWTCSLKAVLDAPALGLPPTSVPTGGVVLS